MTIKSIPLAKFAAAAVVAGGAFAAVAEVTVDFGERYGEVNPWIHCSSWCSQLTKSAAIGKAEADALKKLNLTAWRTHDAPLVATGQRVVDTHFIFPLLHLDAKDPKNYFFKATDNLFKMVQEENGMKIFYRLGSSIEHTRNEYAVNTLDPGDHDKYAEVLAGIVRHYTKGWADGFNYDIKYWELFNEPDISPNWRGTKKAFIHLFVTCLKRLKSEFPEIKVGGPALAWAYDSYIPDLLKACKEADVKPDFISWHHYGTNPDLVAAQPPRMKALVAKCGFPDVDLILNEWHFLVENNWDTLRGSRPEDFLRTHTGPASQNGIDSAAYTLAVESKFQDSCLSQAYFYGCGYDWDWGWVDRLTHRLVKPYYAIQAMGELVKDCKHKVKTASSDKGVTPFAAVSADGRTAVVLIADYRSGLDKIEIAMKGLSGFKVKEVRILDDANDLMPVAAKLEGDRMTLKKNDKLSSCFLIRLESTP